MPTSGYNFTAQEITVRFRTPYISETLNKQFRGIVSAGVYEGFNPKTSLSPLHILLAVDPSGRSSALAVSDLDPTISVGVHLVADVDLDLSAYFSKTVAVCIDLSYAFPSDTTGVINVYDLGTETVPATSCILARVLVPAAGLIPAANISLNGRSFPFLSRGRDATPLVSVVRNGAPYLTASLSVTPDFWENTALVGMSYIASNAVLAPSGFDLTFRARKTAAGVGSITGRLTQKIGLPIPANRRLRLTGAFRPTVVPSIGNPTLIATITDAAGVAITLVTVPLVSAIVGVWQTFSTTVQLPAVTSTPAVLKELSINCSAVTFTTVGANATVFDVADVDLQLEQNGPATDALPEISGESHFTKTRHYADAFPGAEFVSLTFNGATTLLTPSIAPSAHTISLDGNVLISQNLTVSGSTFLSNLDTPAPVDATSLTVGGTNALSVLIGRALRNTEVRGVLLVGTATNPDAAQAHILGNMTISGTQLRVRSGVGLPFNLTSMTGTGFTYTGALHTFVGAITQSAGAINVNTGASNDLNLKTLQGDITLEVTGAGQLDILTNSNVINIGSSTSDINIFAGGVSLLGGFSGATVWAGNSPPAYVNTLVAIGSEVGTKGISIFAGGTPPLPGTNALLLGGIDDIGITTAGAGGLIQIAAVAPAGAVVISAGDEVNATATRVRIGSPLVGGGVVLFAGGAIPAFSPGTILIGTAVGSGGISVFSGGTPPAVAPSNLRLGAVGPVSLESTLFGVSVNAIGAGIACVAETGFTVAGLNSAGPFTTTIGAHPLLVGGSSTINLAGVVSVAKRGAAKAFSVSGCVTERTFTSAPFPGFTFPSISVLKGRYGFRVMLFYAYVADNGKLDCEITPASGTTSGQAVISNTFVGVGPVNQHVMTTWSASPSAVFLSSGDAAVGPGDSACVWVDGEIEFTADTLLTCHVTVSALGPIQLREGSYFRFFAHFLS